MGEALITRRGQSVNCEIFATGDLQVATDETTNPINTFVISGANLPTLPKAFSVLIKGAFVNGGLNATGIICIMYTDEESYIYLRNMEDTTVTETSTNVSMEIVDENLRITLTRTDGGTLNFKTSSYNFYGATFCY